MHNISPVNLQFLEDYYVILPHHMNSILKCGLILDEDINLLLTFWNPNFYPTPTSIKQHLVLISATFATAGLITSLKCDNISPLLISMVPATVQLCKQSVLFYWVKRYQNNFDQLLSIMRAIYNQNKDIIYYYNKRDSAVYNQKLQLDAFNILLKPGIAFLKFAISILYQTVNKIKDSMLNVCKLVPIFEAEYMCKIKWNLENLLSFNENSFNEMKLQFEKLSDLYLLITSNFLSCIGLSFCIQLWKEPCDFSKIFDQLIPDLVWFLDKSVNEVKKNFSLIHYNLCDDMVVRKEITVKPVNVLHRPITDLLLNLQITFETTKSLHRLVQNCDDGLNEDCYTLIEEINTQLQNSQDDLNVLIRRSTMLAEKQPEKKDPQVKVPDCNSSSDKKIVNALCSTENDVVELQDEEYTLSIHEIDSHYEDCQDYSDYQPSENLSVVLLELKKKLLEREDKVGKQAREETSNLHLEAKLQDLSPVEAPPIRLPIMPSINDVNGLMKAVTLTAQKLNRSEEFQFGFNMFPEIPRPFNTTYRCFSVAMLPGNERQDVERGGKIIMPPSALEQLTRLNINYPMQFKIVNKNTNRTSHCGVLEFVADEGKVYLPLWMMHNLVLEEGDLIQIESVSLLVGTFAKFQPLSPEFLDITNPKAVLENCLRTFSCLTSGDVIAVKYNQRVYELCVLETQPGKAISIIECDMNVEFAAPVGYKETEEVKQPEEGMAIDPADLMPEPAGFVAFRGTGNRLDGKRRKDSGTIDGVTPKPVYIRGIPDYDYRIGALKFLRLTPKTTSDNKEENGEFKAFSGEGFSLRQRN